MDAHRPETVGEIDTIAERLEKEIRKFIDSLPPYLTEVQKEEMLRLAHIMIGSLRHARERYNTDMAEIRMHLRDWHSSTIVVRHEQALAKYRDNVETNKLRSTSLRTTFLLFNPAK